MKYTKRIFVPIIALLLSVTWILITYSRTGIFYETNDDRHINEILSGVFSLAPEGHAVYINYMLAKPLSWLYNIIPEVPCYGLFLIACHVLVWTVLLIEFWGICEKWIEYLGMTVYLALFYLCCLHLLGNIQYTSTAALLAVCGYVCYLMESSNKRRIILLTLFEAMAYLLRSKSMLMILPIGISAVAAYLFFKENALKRIGNVLQLIVILLVIIGIGFVADKAAYCSSEWHDYMKFNQARTFLFDYHFCPEYQDVKMILDKYGVSEIEYNAFTGYTMIDCNITTECLGEIADFVQDGSQSKFMPLKLLKDIFSAYTANLYRINVVVFSLYFFVLLWVLVFRKFRFLPSVVGILSGELFVWGYLAIGGRMPFRVIFPLHMAEVLLLSAVLVLLYRECRSGKTGFLMIFAILTISYSCFRTGQLQYKNLVEQKKSREIMEQSLHGLIDYCNDNPDNTYIIGEHTFCYFFGEPLDKKNSMPRNFIIAGTWYSNSPASNAYQTQYLVNGWSNIYLIVCDGYDGEERMDENAIRYIQERTGVEPVTVDQFELPLGEKYAVYYFQ